MLFGLMMIFSASSVKSLAETHNHSMYLYFQKQLENNIVGLVAGVVVAMYPYTKWKGWMLWANGIMVVLLMLVGFTPLGLTVNGAKRWLDLEVFQSQPSEIAKVFMSITLAYLLSVAKNRNNINTVNTFG